MKLWQVEHFYNIFVFTFGRDCWIQYQSCPKVKTNVLWKCSTRQSFIFPKWHSFKIGTLEVSLEMALPVEIKDEFDAGLGKSWGWALLFWVTVFAPILVSWPAAPLTWVADKPAAVTWAAAEVTEAGAGCKVYWIPPCWITVGVVDEVNSLPRPVDMFITGWGLKMMFWILLKNEKSTK